MFFPSFSPTTLTVKHAFEKSSRRLLAGRNLPVDVCEMLFSLSNKQNCRNFPEEAAGQFHQREMHGKGAREI